MKTTNRQYAIALFESLKDCPEDQVSERISNFLKILQKNKQLKNLGVIVDQFIKYYREQNQVLEVQATTAKEINVEELKKELSGKLNQDIELEVEVDPSILAGLILKIGDTLVDGSTKSQLNNLKNKLTS